MAKTRGTCSLNENELKAIVKGQKQGRTHDELAKQFGVSINNNKGTTKVQPAW